jgi:tetratricopeptide (TPR) repeat protein/TolB-like protein
VFENRGGVMKKAFCILSLTTFLFFFSSMTPCSARQMNILVQPFENTGSKEYSWISAGMTDSVIADLTRIQDISVVSNQDRKKAMEEMKFIFSGLAEEEKMIKLGKLTGANVIFTGSYLVSGKRIRVYARLVNVETGKVESTAKIDGRVSDIFDLQDKVVFTLMSNTEKIQIADIKPVKLTDKDKKVIAEKPKTKSTAYEWYAKGLEVQDTNPKEALINFKKALDIDPNYTDALIEAGFTAGKTLNLFSEGLGYLERAERVFKSRNDTKSSDYAKVVMKSGNVYDSKGQLDQALESYLSAKSILERLGLQNTNDYARIVIGIGNVYWSRGQFDQCLEYYLSAKSIREGLGLQNTNDYAQNMMGIGNVYWQKGQFDQALEYYLRSKFIQEQLGLQNTNDYASTMYSIGNVYFQKGQLDQALEYYLKDKSIEDRLGLQNTSNYSITMTSIGAAYLNKGQRDRALEYFLSAKSIREGLSLQNTVDYAILMMNIGVLYEQQGKRDMAGKHYRMSYDTYVKVGYSGEYKDKALNNAMRLGF